MDLIKAYFDLLNKLGSYMLVDFFDEICSAQLNSLHEGIGVSPYIYSAIRNMNVHDVS